MRLISNCARVVTTAVLGAGLAVICAIASAADNPPPSPENQDLERIPPAVQSSSELPTSQATSRAPTQRLYVESALTITSSRDDLIVPAPPPPAYDWQERLFADVRWQWKLGDRVQASYSGRLNLRFENDISFPSQENLINDLREASLQWEPADGTYLDIGRINIKSGVALGFNPTDFFKTRAVVEPLSADPTVLREDRLGTLLLRAQHIWEKGTLTAAFAPAVANPTPIYTNLNLPSFDPMFDRTNAQTRWLLKGTLNLSSHFSPELLVYRGGSQTTYGLNFADAVGQHVITYVEWSGGHSGDIVAEAYQFGRESGTLPPNAPPVLPAGSTSFKHTVAVGASYTTESRVTINLEYHYNQAGFTNQTWDQWFAAGRGHPAESTVSQELWFVRDYALDQQEPISRNYLFLRADWVDAFVPKLELTGLIDVDLRDGSSLVQIGASYYLSHNWTVGGQLISTFGSRDSNFGSLPLRGSVLITAAYYF
jgi:hypothetical protein